MSRTAQAPSESCEELPAVTLPSPLEGSKYGFSAASPSKRRIGAVTFVVLAPMNLLADYFARFLINNAADHFNRRDFFLMKTFGLRPGGPLLAR